MMMRLICKSIVIVLFSLCSAATFAQELNSGYFTDDFKYRHDLNPAFGNEQNYVSMPVLGNLNVTMSGNFGLEDVLFDNPNYPDNSDKKKTTFMNPYIVDGLKGFHSGDNNVGARVAISLLSAGFKAFRGYNTVELNFRTVVNGKIPYELFEFARNTGNKEYQIGDITVDAQSFAELAFGHSCQLTDQLRIGGKVKFLFGIVDASLKMKDVTANLTGDTWTVHADAQADVSMKGFSYKSGTKEYQSKEGTYDYVNGIHVDGAGLGGFGLGLDIGAAYQINEDFTVSAAILDLGFISWSNDEQAENTQKTFTFDGFHDLSVTSDRGSTVDDQANGYRDQVADFAHLQDQGNKGGRTTGIGATMNVGGSYVLPSFRRLSFGLLSSTRFAGDYTTTECRVSTNVAPLSWIDGGVNLAVNTYYTSLGWILNIHPKGVNLFIGMDQLLGSCSKEGIPLNSNASISMGINFTW